MKYLPLLALGLLATPAFADDVNVPFKPLPNATATIDKVTLSCLVRSDASLGDCRLADGAKASKKDQDAAIGVVNGKGHFAGAFVAGQRANVTVVLRSTGGLAMLPVG